VRCYHGLGDTLQFIRFAAPLRQIASEVVVWCQPQLIGLIRRVSGVDRVLPLHDGTPHTEYDVDIEVMELAYALRVSPESLGRHVPYVACEAVRARAPSGVHRAARPRVGIVWAGGNWNASRTLPMPQLERLATLPCIELCSLQFGGSQEFLALTDLSCQNLCELARRMATLDLVISVDTMVAHLAGAMGLPVWTLLPAHCDWRWMHDREDSPWYPSMKLYRQTIEGGWPGLIDRVQADLARFAGRSG
jgi:hypothetical protein